MICPQLLTLVAVLEAMVIGTAGREPTVCDSWSEYFVSTNAADDASASRAIDSGNAVMLIPNLATAHECKALVVAAHQAALPFEPAPRVRLQIEDCLDAEHQSRAHALIARALDCVEGALPELAASLFGEKTGLRHMDLSYAKAEPAINIYQVGGHFLPHRDKHSLSVLVTLSPPDSFSGGGARAPRCPTSACAGATPTARCSPRVRVLRHRLLVG